MGLVLTYHHPGAVTGGKMWKIRAYPSLSVTDTLLRKGVDPFPDTAFPLFVVPFSISKSHQQPYVHTS